MGIPTVLDRLIQQAMAQLSGSDGEVVGGQLLNKLALEFPGQEFTRKLQGIVHRVNSALI